MPQRSPGRPSLRRAHAENRIFIPEWVYFTENDVRKWCAIRIIDNQADISRLEQDHPLDDTRRLSDVPSGWLGDANHANIITDLQVHRSRPGI